MGGVAGRQGAEVGAVAPGPAAPAPSRTRRRIIAPLVAAGILSVLSVSGWGCAAPEAPVREGDRAPRYSGALLDGGTLALDELRGEPVLVNLWATWCAPCREETPFLESLHRDWEGAGLRMVGISVDAASAGGDVRRFLEEFDVTYPVVHDPGQEVMRRFGAIGLPSTYLIDADGVVRWVRMGPVRATDPFLFNALRDVTRSLPARGEGLPQNRSARNGAGS